MEMRHALLIRAHRLHTRCRDARWARRGAQRVNTVCPLCKQATDNEHHALSGECTNAGVIQIIKDRHDHAVGALWRGLKHGSLGGLPMWTDIETRSQTAATRGGARRRKLPTFLLEHSAQHSLPDIVVLTLPDTFVRRDVQGNVVTAHKWRPENHPWDAHPADSQGVALHLVEVKYTYDLGVHALVRRHSASMRS